MHPFTDSEVHPFTPLDTCGSTSGEIKRCVTSLFVRFIGVGDEIPFVQFAIIPVRFIQHCSACHITYIIDQMDETSPAPQRKGLPSHLSIVVEMGAADPVWIQIG